MPFKTRRIAQKDLEEQADAINEILNAPRGDPRSIGYKVGNHFIQYAYGGCALQKVVTEGGCIIHPLGQGFYTKRELFEKLNQFILRGCK